MIIDFHGMKCRYGTYKIYDEQKPILTLINPSDWKKSLEFDFTEPLNGIWCHFLTDDEIEEFIEK